MKEAMRSIKLRRDQQDQLQVFNYYADDRLDKGIPVTARQVFTWMQIDHHIIPGDIYFSRFFKRVERGMFAGIVDWDVVTDTKHPHLMFEDNEAGELWVFSNGVINWAYDTAKTMDYRLVVFDPPLVDAATVYKAAKRAYLSVLKGEKYHVITMSDVGGDSYHQRKAVTKLFNEFIRTWVKRYLFNNLVPGELWAPEGLYLPTDKKPKDFTDTFKKISDEADSYVRSYLDVHQAGLTKKNLSYSRCNTYYLSGVGDVELTNMIMRAQGRIDRGDSA